MFVRNKKSQGEGDYNLNQHNYKNKYTRVEIG